MVWRLTPEARASPAAAMPRLRRNAARPVWTRGSAGVVLSLLDGIVVYTIPLRGAGFGGRGSERQRVHTSVDTAGRSACATRGPALHSDDMHWLRAAGGRDAEGRCRGGGGLEVRHGGDFAGISPCASGCGTADLVRILGQFLFADSQWRAVRCVPLGGRGVPAQAAAGEDRGGGFAVRIWGGQDRGVGSGGIDARSGCGAPGRRRAARRHRQSATRAVRAGGGGGLAFAGAVRRGGAQTGPRRRYRADVRVRGKRRGGRRDRGALAGAGAGRSRQGAVLGDSAGRLSPDRAGRPSLERVGRYAGVPRVSGERRGAGHPEEIRLLHAGESMMDWLAIWLSMRLAACTTLILLAVGMPLAYWLAFLPRRWEVLGGAGAAPLEVSGGGGGGASAGASADGAGVLHSAGDRTAQPGGRALRQADRRYAAVLVSGAAAGFGALQPAVHGAAHRVGVRGGRWETSGSVVVPRDLAHGDVPARRGAVGAARDRHRRHPQLCPYDGRVRRGADGGRQHRGRHAHRVDFQDRKSTRLNS